MAVNIHIQQHTFWLSISIFREIHYGCQYPCSAKYIINYLYFLHVGIYQSYNPAPVWSLNFGQCLFDYKVLFTTMNTSVWDVWSLMYQVFWNLHGPKRSHAYFGNNFFHHEPCLSSHSIWLEQNGLKLIQTDMLTQTHHLGGSALEWLASDWISSHYNFFWSRFPSRFGIKMISLRLDFLTFYFFRSCVL